jgi:thiamine monophosphate synthase
MNRLIVISSENDLTGENKQVTELFREGMQLFHLRKPHWTIETQRTFLHGIPEAFRHRISVHQHASTVGEFNLRYCHIRESDRQPDVLFQEGINYSTSFHAVSDIAADDRYSYCFLSPVFDSISKSGYTGKFQRVRFDFKMPVYALGGITPANAAVALERGFAGVAALGYIWSDPALAVKHFKNLNRICNASVLTSSQ